MSGGIQPLVNQVRPRGNSSAARRPGRHPEVLEAQTGATRLANGDQQGSPVPRQSWREVRARCVDPWAEILRRGPGIVGAAATGDPDVGTAAPTGAVRPEEYLPPIGADRRFAVVCGGVVEFCDGHRWPYGLTVARQSDFVDVASPREVEAGGPTLRSRDVGAAALVHRGVDLGAEVDRRSPTEIVVRVGSTRYPDIFAPKATLPGAAGKEEQQAVGGECGCGVTRRGIDVGPKVHRLAPRTLEAGSA